VRRALALIAVLAAALGAAAAPARASTLEIGMEDESLLLSNPHLAPAAVDAWRGLGVKLVRLHARWWEIAPARKPAGFRAGDHTDPRYDWARLDAAIALVRGHGINVMLSITGPGPVWTSSEPRLRNPRHKPRPADFRDFARAVATRYGDVVDRYLIWNEPNQPGWLQPQSECRRRVCTPVAPHVYRALVNAATPAIHAADPGSEVVIGELAPIGRRAISPNTPLAPLPFLRALGCVDERYVRLRRGRCAGFKPVRADSIGYHPHPVRNPPDRRNPDVNEAQFGDLKRLFAVIDRLKRAGRVVTSGALHLTEFGYQTSPPDHAVGVTLAQQNRYLQQAAYIAWRAKRVRSLSFYQWDDEPVIHRGGGTRAYSGWQSGLRFVNGKPKPALSTFAAPFVIDRASRRAWGQVRPDAEPVVTLLVRPPGASEFQELAQVQLAPDGSFTRRIALTPGAAYRYRWQPKPTLLDPLPQPRLSGIVHLSGRDALAAAAAT
jgi:hypothetical protein